MYDERSIEAVTTYAMRDDSLVDFDLNTVTYTCLKCQPPKAIAPARRCHNFRQHSFMHVAMKNHIRAHVKRGEIKLEDISEDVRQKRVYYFK